MRKITKDSVSAIYIGNSKSTNLISTFLLFVVVS